MASTTKPLVLIGCTPIYGHVSPIRAIAKGLISKGYEVTFVSSSHWRKIVEEIGASYVSIEGYGDYYEAELESRWPERFKLPPGPIQLKYDIENTFIKCIPSQHEAMQVALKQLKEQHPDRPIIQLSEAAFFGALPVVNGAGSVKPEATLGVGIIPMTLSSVDLAPFGPGIPPDSSPEGLKRNKAMAAGFQQAFTETESLFASQFEIVGAKKPSHSLFDAPYLSPDRFVQMCIPSAEYPRSDALSTIRFAGGLPKGDYDPLAAKQLTWWDEVANNNGKKKIVGVSQGSLALDYTELIIPTLEAFKDRKDILVVVALGSKDAKLPEGTPIPPNARVADWIPFDDLLPNSEVFISNGGYGAFQHAIKNGTPLIVAGDSEDKPETATRAEFCGIGVNLRTGKPTPEALRNAVDEILSNPKYKTRGKELEAEMATFDPISVVAQQIDELAAGHHLS
ncbi:hypothetical protein G7Y89_g1501 [Cudoniella acicularis]|uniref:Erythromycin biosynthesis protein CIII-like C-terminal domain-containing protein n=1 Tax=Cudoniella acicularis TaxID=354080 RepID=A0A8H4W7C7_9HELO|nr:hypothetical protein G7Y89_g1501 [Cudoniella acicularis]